ncbi:MAG: hypothetical protein HY078_17375 [Elusimicrobia bacterium]|nr:hypothetical protein [Elusimicrobiota bacterium]
MFIVALIAVFIAFIVAIAVWYEKNAVRGVCPTCTTEVDLLHGVGACGRCGEALRAKENGFVPVEAGFVPDHPRFLARFSRLKPPSTWKIIWPGRCCVCAGSATREEKMDVKSVAGQVGPMLTPLNITASDEFAVGYCASHSDGVRFSFPPGIGYAKKNEQCMLAVRSVDYYREFMRENGLGRQVSEEAGG